MKYFVSLLLLVSFISCNEEETTQHLGQSDADIVKYIETNNLDAQKTSKGVYYVIDEEGEGDLPTANSYVKLIYKGYLLDGSVFDLSDEEGLKFDLLNVITGFSDGLLNFKEGEKGKILIPPSLAYGDNGISDVIPGGAAIIFDVEILKVYNPETEEDIEAYIEENQLDTTKSETGLFYVVEALGDGEAVTKTSNVLVKYDGYFLDGTKFDSSGDEGVQIDLNNVIPGFSEGLSYFKEGGKGTILLPSELGYGDTGSQSGAIPRNTVLIFNFEIISATN